MSVEDEIREKLSIHAQTIAVKEKKIHNFENWHPVFAKRNHKFALSYLKFGLSFAVVATCSTTRTNERTAMLLVPIDSYFQLECVENYYLNLVLRLKFDFIFIFCFLFLFSFNFFLPFCASLYFRLLSAIFFPLLIFFHWFVGMVQQVPHLKSKTVRFFIFKIKSIVEPMKKNETCNNSDNNKKKTK